MNNKFTLATIFISIGAIVRLLPHPPNMTPVAAMALIGGVYLGRKYLSFLVPLLCLFISDMILNNTINKAFIAGSDSFILFEPNMMFTYSAFALTVFIGIALKNLRGMKLIVGGTLFSSLLFFMVTNFGAWSIGTIFPKTAAGLLSCYIAGIPFFLNTLIGSFIFISLFVFGIETISKRASLLQKA